MKVGDLAYLDIPVTQENYPDLPCICTIIYKMNLPKNSWIVLLESGKLFHCFKHELKVI